MAKYKELKGGSKKDQALATSEIFQDKNCRQVLSIFIKNKLLSIDDIFGSLSLMRHEVVISIEKLCAVGLVKGTIADPHVFFGLNTSNQKKLQELLEKHENI